jgi:hypothetical protein
MLHSIRSLTHRTASFDRKQSNYSGYWLVKTEGFLCNPCNKSGFSFSWMLPIRECVKMSYFYQDLKDLLILIKMIVTSCEVQLNYWRINTVEIKISHEYILGVVFLNCCTCLTGIFHVIYQYEIHASCIAWLFVTSQCQKCCVAMWKLVIKLSTHCNIFKLFI